MSRYWKHLPSDRIAAVNILNKKSRTSAKVWFSSVGARQKANNSSACHRASGASGHSCLHILPAAQLSSDDPISQAVSFQHLNTRRLAVRWICSVRGNEKWAIKRVWCSSIFLRITLYRFSTSNVTLTRRYQNISRGLHIIDTVLIHN
jgi:hypothetical protein